MAADASASEFGRYRLGRLLGRGGMGEVYLAHDQTLDRDVAIKFVAADKVGDEAAGRRLLHEAHSAAALDHPCICTVYETGRTPEGHAFIVMQYVEGQPLSAMLQAGPIPVRDALSIAANIAEAGGPQWSCSFNNEVDFKSLSSLRGHVPHKLLTRSAHSIGSALPTD